MGAREMSDAAKKYLLTVNGNEALLERIKVLEAQIAKPPEDPVSDEERAALAGRSGGKPPVKNFGR